MPRILYVTTDLPYFPGQGGLMPLLIQHLAGSYFTGVVGPRYPHQPEDALQRLRDTVQRSYWYPEHAVPGEVPEMPWSNAPGAGRWIRLLPAALKIRLLRRLTGLNRNSDDALAWRIAITLLAPKLLEALANEQWNVVLLAQSNSSVWLPFLPASLARSLYFHDVRADYLRKSPLRPDRGSLRRVLREERQAVQQVDSIAFVSQNDLRRAESLLHPTIATAVAPICIDPVYFAFQPIRTSAESIVLFTGNLSHPPNVDAVVNFISEIWPHIISKLPAAKFRVVGLQPSVAVTDAIRDVAGAELIANVPDIRPYFATASVYVVPIRYGGGVRQKILEAWAVGLPVVSTRLGVDGIEGADESTCWIKDEPVEFATQTIALLNQAAPPQIMQKARARVVEQHSAAISGNRLAAQVTAAIGRRRQSPVRVLYDLRWLKVGKVGGVEQMTHELVSEIASYDRTFAYRFWGQKATLGRWRFPAGFNSKAFYTDGGNGRWEAYRNAMVNILAEDLALPRLSSPELSALEQYTRLDFTIVHGLACVVHRDLRRFPSVVTMHDLQHLHLPEFFSAADIATRELEYRESCRLARHIICVSEFTRHDVHTRYGVPLEKMTTVWNLPPRSDARPMNPKKRVRLLKEMGVTSPYIFYPAQPWAHKNHIRLLEAMIKAEASLPSSYCLVLIGQPLPTDHVATGILRELTQRRRVLHLGYRSNDEVIALYHHAEAMIFPSLFEGFGMPLVEAMQYGCPVICGQHTAIPEVAGKAAFYTDVTSAEGLCEAVLTIAWDSSLRDSLRQRGFENARRFDRRSLAEKTRTVYQAAQENHFG